jgi:LmbE family N-acetylglucosaminyl deacetylase
LDIHDGELMPTLENRRKLVRLIREWNADIVMSHRPNDYHPDHRYVGVLVQDAAYMVTVPFFCPDTPHLRKNPVFMYYSDNFQKPHPFQADVVVAVDGVMDKKLEALGKLVSQFHEGGRMAGPTLPISQVRGRDRAVKEWFRTRNQNLADDSARCCWTGTVGRGAQVKYAEAFELCEYGRQPDQAALKQLFSFAGD